jgi:hypothetical protein
MPGHRSSRHRPLPETERPERPGSPSVEIDALIQQLPDWRGRTLSRLRTLIHQVRPDVVEEIKWRKPTNPGGVPVWSHHGILCLGNVWRDHVRLTFSKGARLDDPKGLFNASLKGNSLRALDLREGDTFDEAALKALLRAAVARNAAASAHGGIRRRRARGRSFRRRSSPPAEISSGG